MNIKITSICRYEGKIEAFKSMSVKLEQKPCKLVRQNRENFIRAQLERDEQRKAAIERAAHERAIQAVLVSAEGASHPRQEWDCHEHRPGQLPK